MKQVRLVGKARRIDEKLEDKSRYEGRLNIRTGRTEWSQGETCAREGNCHQLFFSARHEP